MTENEISKVILDCAIAVHKELGPGLLEASMKSFWRMNWGNVGCM